MRRSYLFTVFLILLNFSLYAQTNLQKLFNECNVDGSITIYDLKNQKWTFSDEKDSRIQSLPASTFKIINSLIALDTGVLKDENEVYKWDGTERPIAAWNGDTDLKNAFKNSTVWFYVELAKKIGRSAYAEYLTKASYGNGNLSQEGNDFWNMGGFGISPEEQIKFLTAFYNETLPFSKRSYEIVKRIMIEETNNTYVLRAKTGLTTYGGITRGWYVGYVQRKDNVYFFATRLTKKQGESSQAFADCRKSITKKILKELDIL